ncbi:MAG TPA: hypothetical protein VN597_14040 [Streptosporangiaceae bacterium]|nr:hypothetical protein [Streptosporangiaceae bacterium]
MTRRPRVQETSPLLAEAMTRLAELAAAGVLEHPGGTAPLPERITAALDLRMLEGPEVDEALGGAEPMVDRWEAGTLEPSPGQVVLLAELTTRPVAWFYGGPLPQITGGYVCFKTKKAAGGGPKCQPIAGGKPKQDPRPVQGQLF